MRHRAETPREALTHAWAPRVALLAGLQNSLCLRSVWPCDCGRVSVLIRRSRSFLLPRHVVFTRVQGCGTTSSYKEDPGQGKSPSPDPGALGLSALSAGFSDLIWGPLQPHSRHCAVRAALVPSGASCLAGLHVPGSVELESFHEVE